MSQIPADSTEHREILSDSLRKLQIKTQEEEQEHHSSTSSPQPTRGPDAEHATVNDPQSFAIGQPPTALSPHVREGYGFRPTSGISTPVVSSVQVGMGGLIPDPNGLGWPGELLD